MMDVDWLCQKLEEDLDPLDRGARVWASLRVRAPDGSYEVDALECPVMGARLPDVVGWAGWGATRSAGEALGRLLEDLHGRYELWPRRGVASSSPLAPMFPGAGATREEWGADDGFALPGRRVARAGRLAVAVERLVDIDAIHRACERDEYSPRWSVACGLVLHGPGGERYEVSDGDLLATDVRYVGGRVVLCLEAPWELVATPGSPLLAACRLAEGPLVCVPRRLRSPDW